jgi:8-oxo-dGTP pyrophosphatase MutT (NUDIX family)
MLSAFIESVKRQLAAGLPGDRAHRLMSPENRLSTQEYLANLQVQPRISAVMVLFFPGEKEIHTVLIKRPDYEGVHSGQIAFPGGKSEEGDITAERTALREAREETGVDPERVTVFGTLSQVYIPPSNFLVTPVLGYTEEIPEWIPDPREVQRILTPALSELLDDSITGVETFRGSSGAWSIDAPYFKVQGYSVWGATAMMISELKELIRPVYPVKNGSAGS